ncbi:IclR family transcriptional regulator [Sphingomonas sp. MA1305]|uniref:IclR family transcriptional regulator n=1 Tax=Sphingomonas sp. MA1305 TaxID=2479204 RepID=UPI0018DF54FB|nr:helix-turn-helix domain-containing protein [Sphingomonas sp. MA1305]MBI0476117.1 IclR family transcriptional regulator [Sphingomonas sp. MA1305]
MADSDEQRRGSGRPTGVQTLERGLDLLERVVDRRRRLGELAAESGLTKSTAWRLTNALIERGYLAMSPTGEMRGGPKLLQLRARMDDAGEMLAAATPVLEALAEKTGISAFLGRRDHDHSVHLYRSDGGERVAVTTPVGTRRPLGETSLGKALMLDDGEAAWGKAFAAAPAAAQAEAMAAMHKAAAAGVVLNQGPPPDRVHAIAAPVRDASGTIVAAISIAGAAQYLDTGRMAKLAPVVRTAGETISRQLGYRKG